YGIPFPGTYVVDENGTVIAKSFERSNAHRASADAVLDKALGDVLLPTGEPTVDTADARGIRFSATLHGGGGVFRGAALRQLIIRAELPDGLHIYGDPVPDGMVATTFTLLGPPGIRHAPVEAPPTEPLLLPGVGELQVWSGTVEFVMPVWASDDIVSLVRADHPDQVTIELEIRYQSCDDQTCGLPRTERLTLDVPVRAAVGPDLAGTVMDGVDRTGMDTGKWLGSLVRRGLDATPDREAAGEYLQRTAASLAEGPGGDN
ncbi:MAG: protein-disulfide reductase DsbD domain-containing protein, partial [Actinomycetota bacterium]